MKPTFRHAIGAWLLGMAVPTVTAAESSAAPPANATSHSFQVPAWAFDRGNAKTFTDQWADAGPMVAFGGRSPVTVEYDLELPLTAEYTLHLQYAAAEARPVALSLDGTNLAPVCRTASGSWNTSRAHWEESCRFSVAAGKHTFKLQRAGAFPHVVGLRFECAQPLPAGWVLHRPKARKLDDPPSAPVFAPYVPPVNPEACRLAIEDLAAEFGRQYPQGAEYRERLRTLEVQLQSADRVRREAALAGLVALQREALLANPLLDFDRLLVVKRHVNGPELGLPRNWQSNSSLPQRGYDDSICLLALSDANAPLAVVFKPARDRFVGDVDLHWDATKLLFSMIGTNDRWQVFEWELPSTLSPASARDARLPRPLTGEQPDVDSYDACYLPDDRILFTSTACFVGVPCVYGDSHVATLYRMDADGRNVRQLGFDQEHNWCPAVLNNGRVLYTRWEYADTPHSNTRLLFQANPDGTGQMEFLGSNSYWPNSFFYARPVPGHPSKIVAVIGGHHDHPRMGELVVFDPARGRHEAAGAVQRIPGRGQPVEPILRDGLTLDSWPKFLHPYPLSEKHFLVSCKPTPDAPWGIYLADVFDNLVPIHQLPDYALFEPLPFRPTPRLPVLPDKVDLTRRDALVVLQDIYAGDGLKGVPRGTVKALRLFTYHFAYQNMGGLLGVVGMDGPWDIKRVLGTVPVHADGSAKFRVPANTPISLQPLDAEGKAIQLMRSWLTAMPGEVVQCTGCHERQNTTPLPKLGKALHQAAADLQPWHGPVRGFSYAREVQPVVDRHCVRCHRPGGEQLTGRATFDLRGDVRLTNWSSVTPGNGGGHAGKFSVGYAALHRYVRRPGIESDYHVLEPMEFHADTTALVQLLQAGHYDVQLDAEDWDRLITWIDLNCPYHGTWGEEIDRPGRQRERRRELLKRYANVDDDPEAVAVREKTNDEGRRTNDRTGGIIPNGTATTAAPGPPWPAPNAAATHFSATNVAAQASSVASRPSSFPLGPFDAAEAQRRQAAAGAVTRRSVELVPGVRLELVLIPAGELLLGGHGGAPPVPPPRPVRLAQPYWLATTEIDNRTYALFDAAHDSRVEDKQAYQFGIHGYPANRPEQPVVRVSWNEAAAFCRWLSVQTGERFTLPTEAQWEWACRAGTDTPFHFGGFETDFSPHANLADAKLSEFASDPYTVDVPLRNPTPFDDWIPKEARFHDGALIAVAPGRYQPNAWGLHDLHGNVAEWTRSADERPPRGKENREERKIVRGGSWRDVPRRCTSDFRVSYRAWQRVFNVGFRVLSEGQRPDLARSVTAELP